MALINVLVDGKIEQRDESELVKSTGGHENDNEVATWVEYRFPGSDDIVHRSAHVTLKQVFADGMIAEFQ